MLLSHNLFGKCEKNDVCFFHFDHKVCYNFIGTENICYYEYRRYIVLWFLTFIPLAAESGEIIETYGIRCGSTAIDDVCLRKPDIEDFVEKLNRFDASEIHAYDLVENFLGR